MSDNVFADTQIRNRPARLVRRRQDEQDGQDQPRQRRRVLRQPGESDSFHRRFVGPLHRRVSERAGRSRRDAAARLADAQPQEGGRLCHAHRVAAGRLRPAGRRSRELRLGPHQTVQLMGSHSLIVDPLLH